MYEIFLQETCQQNNLEGLCAKLLQNSSPEDVVIVHKNQKNNDTAYFYPPSYPCIMLNRRLHIKDSFTKNIVEHLDDDLKSLSKSDEWQLQLYLDTTSLQNGGTEVDVSICNLEKYRTFNGNYTIWLVEQIRMQHCDGTCWTVRQVIARGDILQLPQDATQGCPLPDHFPLPAKQDMGHYALVGAVFDTSGAVQAVAWEALSGQ